MLRRSIGRGLQDMEKQFFAELVTEASVPTTDRARTWLLSHKPNSLLSSFEWLRLAQRFEMPTRLVEPAVKNVRVQLNTKPTVRALSLVASALADWPTTVAIQKTVKKVFAGISSDAEGMDVKVLNRFCRAAVTHSVSSEKIGNLLDELKTIPDPDDIRWLFAYAVTFKHKQCLPVLFKALTQDAALLSSRDLVAVLGGFAKISDFPPTAVKTAVTALTEVKVAALRHSATMSGPEIAALVHALGMLGMWTHSCGGLVSRHVHRVLDTTKRDDLAGLLVGAIGSRTSSAKFLRAYTVASILKRFNKKADASKVGPLTAARILWAIEAGDLTEDEIKVEFDGKWLKPYAVAAQKAKKFLLPIVRDSASPSTVPVNDRPEYFQLVREIFGTRSTFLKADEGLPVLIQPDPSESVFIDASPVPGFLRRRQAREAETGVVAVDPLSWAALRPMERTKWLSEKKSLELFNTLAHSATALPPWNAEELKLPPQALKWSIRRANAHH